MSMTANPPGARRAGESAAGVAAESAILGRRHEVPRDAAQRQRIAAQILGPLHPVAHPFAVAPVPHAIRLALGSVDLDALRRALEAVARVVADQTDR